MTDSPVGPGTDGTSGEETSPNLTTGPDPTTGPDRTAAPDPRSVRLRPAVPSSTQAEAATHPPFRTVARHRRRSRLGARLRRLPVQVGRAVAAWSRRPSGQLALPGTLLVTALTTALITGAVLVPASSTGAGPATQPTASNPTGSPDSTLRPPVGPSVFLPEHLLVPTFFGIPPTGSPPAGSPPVAPPPTGSAPATQTNPARSNPAAPGPTRATAGADAGPPALLADWAAEMSTRTGIPQVALQAYGYAELVVAHTTPDCRLSWTTLAAIGRVESGHGSSGGARLLPDGRALPPIFGDPLDGQGDRQHIPDTDGGALDHDPVYDRAVGPMQFIPATWALEAVDATGDGVADPHNLHDAALAAANYLCRHGRDLATPAGWWSAVLAYNHVDSYARAVFTAADEYGQRSRLG